MTVKKPAPGELEPIETASRDALAALQLDRLRWSLAHAYEHVPHYRRKFDAAGVHPGDLTTLADLARFPFTTKHDLRDNYPFGMFAVPREQVARIHASSGTTGKPTVVGYTAKDIDTWATVMARSIRAAGGRAGDIIHVAYGYGLFTGGLGAHYGAERLGATVIPMSGGMTERQVQLIHDFKPDIIMVTPSYMLAIAEEMERQGIEPRSCSLKIGIFGAEPWTPAMRTAIETKVDLDAIDIYGLSEIIGPGVSSECVEAQSGLHVNEDHFYPEIINPATGEQLPYGQEGELVITSMSREAMPLIRYRTGDITSLNPEKCICGRTLVRMRRVRGRADDMLIIRGVNVFPSQVESVLLRSEEVAPHYIIEVNRKGRMDEMNVLVEVTPKFMEKMASKVLSTDLKDFVQEEEELVHLKREIQKNVKDIIGVNTDITLRPPNTIQRSEGKAKRVIDNRPK
jgi:phenylacetate-CoA ligase